MRRTELRRTGFKSRMPPRPPREERVRPPLTPIRVPTPSAPIFYAAPKTVYLRDQGYRRFVASLPCFECGIEGISQAAHSDQGSAGKGKGLKASDEFIFPLCCTQPGRIGCHEKHDLLIGMDREVRVAREDAYLARMASFSYEKKPCAAACVAV